MDTEVVPLQEVYRIGIITALSIERAAITAMLDKRYAQPQDFNQLPQDPNTYSWGCIGKHNVVLASSAAGVYGNIMAMSTAIHMQSSILSVKIGLIVGIGGGIPRKGRDVRLGDVVVSQRSGRSGGVFQYWEALNIVRLEITSV